MDASARETVLAIRFKFDRDLDQRRAVFFERIRNRRGELREVIHAVVWKPASPNS